MQFITCPCRNLGLLVPQGTFFFISSRIPQGFTCAALPNTLPGWGKQLELVWLSDYSRVNEKQCQWTRRLREAPLLVLIWSNVTLAVRQWTPSTDVHRVLWPWSSLILGAPAKTWIFWVFHLINEDMRLIPSPTESDVHVLPVHTTAAFCRQYM